eukprot:461656_1
MQPDQAAGSELSTGSYSPVSAIESIVPDHDGANRYTCTEHNCNRSFGASARLRSHIKYDHEGLPKPYRCCLPGCSSNGFMHMADLARHSEEVHTIRKQYPCNICGIKFTRLYDAEVHQRNVHVEKTIQCESCACMFKTKHALRKHVRRMHTLPAAEPAYPCQLCDKRLKSPGGLRDHVSSIHSAARPFVCDICNKCFARKFSLKRHIPIHNPLSRQLYPCPKFGCFTILHTKYSMENHTVSMHDNAAT